MIDAGGGRRAVGLAARWAALAGAVVAGGLLLERLATQRPAGVRGSKQPLFAWAVEAARRQRAAAARLGVPAGPALDANGVPLRLALIPPGEFPMGSPREERCRREDEGPRRIVRISRAFYMGVYEVTQRQYRAVMGANPSDLRSDDRPVECVSWWDAAAFCRALSKATGRVVRLPTEAEWEYACRAGSEGVYNFGLSSRHLWKHANYCERANTDGVPWQDVYHDDGHDRTAPVGSYPPNAWGLYDMHGNVWEWCADRYAADAYRRGGRVDPRGPAEGLERVARGGSWLNNAANCRSANRAGKSPGQRTYAVGFRVVVEVGGKAGEGR